MEPGPPLPLLFMADKLCMILAPADLGELITVPTIHSPTFCPAASLRSRPLAFSCTQAALCRDSHISLIAAAEASSDQALQGCQSLQLQVPISGPCFLQSTANMMFPPEYKLGEGPRLPIPQLHPDCLALCPVQGRYTFK